MKEKIDNSGTGIVLIAMLLYGAIALYNDKISFNWKIAIMSILFIFTLEVIVFYIDTK